MDWKSRRIDNRFPLGIFLLGVLSFLFSLVPEASFSKFWFLKSDFLEPELLKPDFLKLCLSEYYFPEPGFSERLLGSFLAALPLFVLTLVFPGAFGGGDIKLLAAGGFFLGWRAMVPAAGVGLLTAAVYAVGRMACGKLTLKSQLPLGPFLAGGMAVGLLWGETLLAWYLAL